MAAKEPAPTPHGKAREQLVDWSASETSETHHSAREERGERKGQRRTSEHGEPPGDHSEGQSDEQRRRHGAEQAGTAERREPVSARGIDGHVWFSGLRWDTWASTARMPADAAFLAA